MYVTRNQFQAFAMAVIAAVQDRLRLAFPESSDVTLARAVQEGSYLAGHLFEGESFLNNAVGHDLRGHIRRVGIAHQIELYCTRGDLPFICAMKPMPKGSWHWLEIKSTGALAHVCRTEDVFTFPEEAESRQDSRLSLQPDLLTWTERDKSVKEVVREIPVLYAWLTFRAGADGKISHLCWGAPDPKADTWIGHVNVLAEIAKRSDDAPAPSTVPDPKAALRLKEHVREALEKNEKKSA